MLYFQAIKNFVYDRWEESKDFVLQKPLAAIIYSVAMKFFGVYCNNFLSPLGSSLTFILFSASSILDISALVQLGHYRKNLLVNIASIRTSILDKIKEFYNTQIRDIGQQLIKSMFNKD